MNIRVFDLTCNDLTEPLAIDSQPVFSWKYDLGDSVESQRAYRLGVASSEDQLMAGNFDCWDTGRVESDGSHHVAYDGKPLHARTTYHWTVTVESADGESGQARGIFETGKRDERWSARWIAAHHHSKPDEALDAPCLRTSFTVAEVPGRARLYICSPGHFDASINGMRVSDEELPSPYTKFDARLLYATYDVTQLLRSGENAMGVIIGNGWYNCFTKDVWNSREVSWRHIPKLIAELHLTMADGSTQVVATDPSWKSATGSIVFNGIRNGEHVDARLTRPGWDTSDLDDVGWDAAKITRPPGGVLRAMEMEPIRITGTIEPVSDWQTPEGAYVFDTGQNMAGFIELTIDAKAGDEIVIRYAERLQDDGVEIDQRAISGFVRSGDFQTDRYTANGQGRETWRPRFVYHGFQYVEVSGCRRRPEVRAHWVHTDVATAGVFACDDVTLNAVQHAARCSMLSNLHSLPTDSPHREKNAWTGDVAASTDHMLLNYHTTPLLRKWLADLRDAQRPDGALPCMAPSTGWGYNWGNGPDWSSALTHIPWQIYLYTGDEGVLRENYEAIIRHFGYMESMAEGGIVDYGIGDWCAPFEGPALAVNMSSFKCPSQLTDTAFYYRAAATISRMAAILGRADDEKDYGHAADVIKGAFRDAFYDAQANTVAGNCQTATACVLYQGLYEEGEQGRLLELLLGQIAAAGYHHDTGIHGNQYVFNVLGEAGRMDMALRMILNETAPSYRDWIDQGATTLWECWNGGGSHNHHMFSDISATFYKHLGGIRPDEAHPGFRHVLLAPAVDCGLRSVQCHHESPYGRIGSCWEASGQGVTLDLEIPSGVTATLHLPNGFRNDDYPSDLAAGTHHIEVSAAV